ncbi:hypothetical protein PL11_002785 [Lentilactobacillus curieae]|uniref:YdbS-like PH domain-containing protein n=1 Tax=Lentilactobacillus curieae TaxID=1138822 RepID=A0A1S6QH18_9LACO|nr:PH domain-containing protein [Lentilactobacillus curieae]AQW20917.1 hypothetical protein PL11_002785 [Lentilactobacillus curieae]
MNQAIQLPVKIKTVWKFSALMTFLSTIVIFGVAFTIGLATEWRWLVYLSYVALGLGLILSIGEFALISYRYAFFRYQLTEDAVQIQKGFIFRERVSVPIARVQDVKIEQGPILRSQNLQSVTVTTASTNHAIDGLEPEVAEQLREQIMEKAMEAVENDV